MRRGSFRSCTDMGVSPVVGVMLMLAVTVMLAAVVSTYAGGFSSGAEKTPQSSIQAVPDFKDGCIYFDHAGGDPFSLSAIQIVLKTPVNRTALSVSDAGGSRLAAFDEVGGTGTGDRTIRAGDTFYIKGVAINQDSMKFGSFLVTNNTRIDWIVIDKDTSKTIARGVFYP